MKITVIGAGAMGCLHGARLAHSGHDVMLIDVRRDVVDAINRDGVHVDGVGGELHVSMRAQTDDDATGPADAVFVLAHTDGSQDAARTASRIIADEGYAITLQNGIGNVEALTDALGRQRVLGGNSFNSASSTGPGRVTHTNRGPTTIGELDGTETDRARSLRDALEQAGIPTQISGNVMGVIWSKFIHSCAITPICAVTGMRAGMIAGCPSADSLQDRILQELLAVARARRIKLADDDPAPAIKEVCRTSPVKPSMLQHVEQGRPTEIDALNGALLREAKAVGIETPYNEAITLMVKALDEKNL